ncbi:ABC transporter ATP-binding protein [Spiribacter halobius]|uniref:Cobalamin/Fe(3+)-siderophore ABC transporter ATP-binding protein n=1 Tax=Sediminicurvatus halobius TaxID=2182432 RepID=A0A2U2N1N6_9GAMM|nr:ABC transporter ATP-binding protein [Spiribacter halobius]PWG63135.1 cobalamin/Fe(3+)-siderophore ABC transporter ATP-binding protein [Spiribacter halobius]UEX77585.1 ABC transporter ATP-binding protein [Spiribacter halobius]
MPDLRARDLALGYDGRLVVEGLDLALPPARITVIVGPNACGKSTLLRALARLLRPRRGAALLDGHAVHRLPTRALARRLGLLPQAPSAPEGLTVEDLVARGRFPHQRVFRYWSPEDAQAVAEALADTEMEALRDRPVDELSGGQRQRAWIAMTLAQQTEILLLDEPTTFLDIAHRLEVLELLRRLNRERGRTIVMVLHDLNEAARHADHLVAMRAGRILAEGPPGEVVTPALVERVFGIASRVIPDPVTGTPLVVPVRSAEPDQPLPRARRA